MRCSTAARRSCAQGEEASNFKSPLTLAADSDSDCTHPMQLSQNDFRHTSPAGLQDQRPAGERGARRHLCAESRQSAAAHQDGVARRSAHSALTLLSRTRFKYQAVTRSSLGGSTGRRAAMKCTAAAVRAAPCRVRPFTSRRSSSNRQRARQPLGVRAAAVSAVGLLRSPRSPNALVETVVRVERLQISRADWNWLAAAAGRRRRRLPPACERACPAPATAGPVRAGQAGGDGEVVQGAAGASPLRAGMPGRLRRRCCVPSS